MDEHAAGGARAGERCDRGRCSDAAAVAAVDGAPEADPAPLVHQLVQRERAPEPLPEHVRAGGHVGSTPERPAASRSSPWCSAGAACLWRRRDGRLCALLALLPVVLSSAMWAGGARIVDTRNLIVVAPFAAIALAAAVAAIPSRPVAYAAGVCVVVAMAAAFCSRPPRAERRLTSSPRSLSVWAGHHPTRLGCSHRTPTSSPCRGRFFRASAASSRGARPRGLCLAVRGGRVAARAPVAPRASRRRPRPRRGAVLRIRARGQTPRSRRSGSAAALVVTARRDRASQRRVPRAHGARRATVCDTGVPQPAAPARWVAKAFRLNCRDGLPAIRMPEAQFERPRPQACVSGPGVSMLFDPNGRTYATLSQERGSRNASQRPAAIGAIGFEGRLDYAAIGTGRTSRPGR